MPQWYMNTPGSFAVNRNVNDPPEGTSMNALSGAIRAAWKSIEWGMAPLFVSVISTVCPWRTWMTGPGAPPSNPQAAYFTPGAISIVTSFSTMCTFTRSPAGTGGSSAGYGTCAAASSFALAGAAPAKLADAVPTVIELWSCVAGAATTWSAPSARSVATTVATATITRGAKNRTTE